MEKYGTIVIFKCEHCGEEVELPLHQKDDPPLVKYASACTHEWKEKEIKDGKSDREED